LREYDYRILTLDEFFTVIDTFSLYFPRFTTGELWQIFFRDFCPLAIVILEPAINYLITLEATCEAYHKLPNAETVNDEFNYILLVFEAVRTAKAQYEWFRQKEMQAEARQNEAIMKSKGMQQR